MHAVALPEIATAYDTVGVYDQDAINGFSDHILTTLLDLINPGEVSHILPIRRTKSPKAQFSGGCTLD